MSVQFIDTPAGRLAVLPEGDYRRLIEAAEDAEDRATIARYRDRLATGEEEALPATMVKHLIEGESPLRVWREHRGLSARALAEKAGLSQAYVSQIEGGRREGSIAAFKALATALDVTIDDIA
ncbi:helix-turn-helix domain-containing protein [Zavarzinia sp.]|uniref:helix-turn-helix domain-containing protein n=1 Tax=Zavarzinia sp. TaxID=2027920 RepID=UPI0035678059